MNVRVQAPYITGLFLGGVRAHLAARDTVEVQRVDGWHVITSVSDAGLQGGLTMVRLDNGETFLVEEPWYHERARTYRVTERDRTATNARWDRVMERLADQDHP